MIVGEESELALSANAPPQQRPTFSRPSWVNRKTGRLLLFAVSSAPFRPLAQPICSQSFSCALGCHAAARRSTSTLSSGEAAAAAASRAPSPSRDRTRVRIEHLI